MFFLCHVTLRQHIIKGTSDLVNVSPLPYVTAVPSLMLLGLVEVETKGFYFVV